MTRNGKGTYTKGYKPMTNILIRGVR